MIRRFMVLMASIVCCLVISSCNFTSFDFNNSSKYDPHDSDQSEDRVFNEETLKEILRCFDERDAETLKNMFSPFKQETYDLDFQIERAFSAYEGVSVSYEGFFDFGYMTKSTRDGKCVEKSVGAEMLNVKTDEKKIYVISFAKCIVNDDDKSQLGIGQIILRDEKSCFLEAIGDDRYYENRDR